ncbi:cation:proton antiporter [Reichenbachiella versicolor]|uniref:cation:proton antiporter n=1 Tax=Reichenbachiella versicolor TaxID=1821036 RepID=UPI000D6E9D29|nr:sodium:proton antiporter [Reichenbachiella versicolor]
MNILDILALFICLAGIFIYINTYYLKLPSSVGLMILAMGLSFTLQILQVVIPEFQTGARRILQDYDYHEVLYQLVLSFMLFAGALQIDFKKLAEERTPVLILALLGVIISTIVIGSAVWYLLSFIGIEMDIMYCLVFGALISPTDPIAVTATIRKYSLSKNLETRIAGESLFNDGIAVVIALTLLDLAHAGEDHFLGPVDILWVFGTDITGGIVIGLFLGYLGYRVLKYIDNDEVEVEVLMTLALVMAGTQIAEFTHVSAKQAVVIMGLVIGNEGKSDHVTSAAGDYVFKFWNLIEETLNAMLFVLIGLEMLIIPLRMDYFAAGLFAFIIVLAARYISVGVPIAVMSTYRTFEKNTLQVLAWGGLRGGIPIALSLSLPEFEGKDVIITMTYTVVVCSVLYQGLTIPRLMKSTFPTRR